MACNKLATYWTLLALGVAATLMGAAPADAAVLLQSDLPLGDKDFDYFLIETEDADDLGASWQLSTHPDALAVSVNDPDELDPVTGAYGAQAITNTYVQTTVTNNSGGGNDATWKLQFDTPGDYYMYIRQHSPLGPTGDRNPSDSFYTPVDFGLDPVQVKSNGDVHEILQAGGNGDRNARGPWVWYAARVDDSINEAWDAPQTVDNFQVFTVEPGDVGQVLDLQIDHREDGTLLDAFLFVSTANGPTPAEVDAALAITLTWDGLGPGNWNSDHWLPGGVPADAINAVVSTDTVTVAADASARNLTVEQGDAPGGGIVISGGRTLSVSEQVSFAPGTTLTFGAGATLAVGGGGSIDSMATAGDAIINVTGNVSVAAYTDGGLAGTLTKQGDGTLSLDNSYGGVDMGAGTVFRIEAGTLRSLGAAPLGGATLQLGGGEVVLASGTSTTDVTYDNAVTVTDGGTLTAGTDGVGQPGPLTVFLGSPDNGLSLEGGVLILRSTDGYRLNVAGDVSGTGGLSVGEGDVVLAGAVDVRSLAVSGGSVQIDNDISVANATVIGGTMNTNGQQMIISDSLDLQNVPFSIDAGNTFTIEGADLLAASDMTLNGGVLAVGTASNGMGDFDVLYVIDPADNPEQGDLAVAARLRDVFGYTVTTVDGPAAITDDATGMDLVMISSTVLSGDVGTIFTDQDAAFAAMAIPTIQWESALNDEFLLSNSGANYDDQDTIIITPEGVDHPLAARLPEGEVLVRNSPTTFHTQRNGNLAPDATVIARVTNNDPAIIVVEPEGLLNDGTTTASARRISLFLGDEGVDDMTDEGLDLFDAAVRYALDVFGDAVPLDLPHANIIVTADSTLDLRAGEDAIFGNLTLGSGVALNVKGPAVSFNDVNGGDGSSIDGALVLRGTLAVEPNAAGTLAINGELEMEDDAQYRAELADGANDLVTCTGDVFLAGTLALQAIGPLGAYGDDTQTIISVAGEEGAVVGSFAETPAADDHLGHGVFHQALTLNPDQTAINVDLFQAAPGDTDVDGDIDNADLQLILAANSFNSGTGFDWVQGDFDGDSDVDNNDLQLILATGKFGTGSYLAMAPASAGGGPAVVPEPGTLVLLALGGFCLLTWRRRQTP